MGLSNYDIMRNQMRDAFIKYNQENMIRKFSLQYDETYIYISFVARDYRIHRQNGIVEWSLDGFENSVEAGYNESMTIYDVLCCSKDNCALSGKYCTLDMLKGTAKTLRPGKTMFQRDIERMTGKTEALRRACARLGTVISMKSDVAALLYPFPFLPLILQYWDADEEFPANLKFMFDENMIDYMHYETIFYLMAHIISRIQEAMDAMQ